MLFIIIKFWSGTFSLIQIKETMENFIYYNILENRISFIQEKVL